MLFEKHQGQRRGLLKNILLQLVTFFAKMEHWSKRVGVA